MKFTLRQKILTGFVICAAILFSLGFYSYYNSQKFVDSSNWVAHTHEVIYEYEQVLAATVDMESSIRGFLIDGDPGYMSLFENARQNIWQHFDNAKKLTADNIEQQSNTAILKTQLEKRIHYHDQLAEAYRKDKGLAETMFATAAGRMLQEQLRNIVNEIIAGENKLLTSRKMLTEQESARFNKAFLLMVLVMVVVLTGIYFIINNNLTALKKAEQESREKNWLLTGSYELNERTRGELHPRTIAQSAIVYLCEYLKAQAGLLYLEEGGMLHVSGTYALETKRLTNPLINAGDSLIGQAALDKRIIIVTDVPEDYMLIYSGMGSIKPSNIAIVPLLMDDSVRGVIEIGSIRGFSKTQIELLTIVSESLGVVIGASQSRNTLTALYEEMQRQAEELEAQQEELKNTNEELEEKTALLERSEMQLKTQQEELQQSNEELGEKANQLELQKEKLEQAKDALEEKAKELELTGRYKSEFLANMSHELRTPLNSILILSQVLTDNRKDNLSPKAVELSTNIHKSGQDLLQLINEILDLSKVESGKMELDIDSILLTDLNNQLRHTFSAVASQKLISFTIDNRTADDSIIVTDLHRLIQILRNLLANAFKFTPENGNVTLVIDRIDSGNLLLTNERLINTKHLYSFSVTDTGIGIPESKLDLVFEAFQQADGSTKRKYGGTGLGLSISRELASALGGELRVRSVEGAGSTFTLYMPQHFDPAIGGLTERIIEVKEKKEVIRSCSESDEGQGGDFSDDRYNITEADKVILIMEDDPAFAAVLLDFVQQRNYKGIIAFSGDKGLALARHYRPDAIILDMKLPSMDGDEVLRHLKSAPDLRHIPVQIISGYDRKTDSLLLGAFDFIQKPVSQSDLLRVFDRIEYLINQKVKKLLIVEDNEQHNNAIRELIGNGDVISYSAFSGSQAHSMMQQEEFDCVIVDLGLPDMSGFDFLDKIKADDKLNTIPVVVYTGKEISREEHTRLMKSANTVVLKTADSHERLLDETMLFLHRVESRLPKEKQTMIRKLHRTDEVLRFKKVLIVDDDIRNVYSITNVLEEEEMFCVVAENGNLALDMLAEHPDISIVLMDIMMPEMDGYEATRLIRKSVQYQHLPIIAITAKAMKGDRERCLDAGMNDYISKPVNIEQLLSLMRVWLYN